MNEPLAEKIKLALTGLCPALDARTKETMIVWHRCFCLVDDKPCACIMSLTSECKGRKWKQLAFVDDVNDAAQRSRDKMFREVNKAKN